MRDRNSLKLQPIVIETPVSIEVKSAYFVKLPRCWLNLANIRQIKHGDRAGAIVVIYDTGEFDLFDGAEAQLLLEALEQTSYIDKSA